MVRAHDLIPSVLELRAACMAMRGRAFLVSRIPGRGAGTIDRRRGGRGGGGRDKSIVVGE